MNIRNNLKKGKMDLKKSNDSNSENRNKELFEFSFFRFSQLKVSGDSQAEIRKTVLKTWWLPVMSFIFAITMIFFIGSNLLEKLLPLFLK